MIPSEYIPALLMGFGIFIVFLSIPWVHERTVQPLQEEGWLPKVKLRKSQREILAGAGPRVSILFTGVFIFFIGLILFLTHA